MKLKLVSSPFALLIGAIGILAAGCKSDSTSSTDPPNSSYQETVLVSDTAGFGASRIDPNLLNAWGLALNPDGSFWIATNHSSMAVNYDRMGMQGNAPIIIPARDSNAGGAPSGAVYNTTNDFNGAKVLFSTEDGIIAAWNSGGSARQMAKSASEDAVYKGIAIANDGGQNFIYVTNFKQSKIDVYDKNFNPISGKMFMDPTTNPAIPADYGPFGIQNIGGKLYVTYAEHKAPDNQDDQAGPGHGFVDVFNPDGSFVKRLASQGTLNSPWGIAMAGNGFGKFANDIIIGNFGDGAINAFDQNGNFMGQISDKNGTVIKTDGLWGISFNPNAGDPNLLYFTAGPNEENHGTFGYIQLK